MDDLVSSDILALLYRLLPGFITAAIVYNFTPRTKGGAFERVIEALVYTLLVQILVAPTKWLLLWAGQSWPIAQWTDSSAMTVAVLWAVVLGCFMARWLNREEYPAVLAKLLGSSRTPLPSEWYNALKHNSRWVVLHLHDGRRIYGWAIAWPDSPGEGYFQMTGMEWLGPDDERIPADRTASLLVSVADIRMVEFVKDTDGIGSRSELARNESNGHRETQTHACPDGAGSGDGAAGHHQPTASEHTEAPATAGPAARTEPGEEDTK
jgi:hypothetical protein